MKRAVLLSLSMILLASEIIWDAWGNLIRVNQYTDSLQATRDSDTPWSMAADDSGNVHFVFESQDDKAGLQFEAGQFPDRNRVEVFAVIFRHGILYSIRARKDEIIRRNPNKIIVANAYF